MDNINEVRFSGVIACEPKTSWLPGNTERCDCRFKVDGQRIVKLLIIDGQQGVMVARRRKGDRLVVSGKEIRDGRVIQVESVDFI